MNIILFSYVNDYIDARKITKRGKSKVDPKRDIATASKYVRIFKRRRGE